MWRGGLLVVPNHHVVEAVLAGLAEELVPDARGLLQEPGALAVLSVADAGLEDVRVFEAVDVLRKAVEENVEEEARERKDGG